MKDKNYRYWFEDRTGKCYRALISSAVGQSEYVTKYEPEEIPYEQYVLDGHTPDFMPFDDRILVFTDPDFFSKTSSGIITASQSQDERQPVRGTVVIPGGLNYSNKTIAVVRGMKIWYSKFAGSVVRFPQQGFGGIEWVCIRFTDIIGAEELTLAQLTDIEAALKAE